MRNLLIDIETSPHNVYTFGLWNANISIDKIIEPTSMLSFAAKWRGEKKVEFYSVFHHGREAMVKNIWELLNEADAVTTYNGKKFDQKHWNREIALAGLTPPSPYKHIDLYQTVKKQFMFASNKLDWALRQFGLNQKVKHTGFDLWVRCLEGDPKAWALMRRYNKGDVTTLEELLDRLLPWITNYPNQNLFTEGDAIVCPTCGSPEFVVREGYALLVTGKYQRYTCKAERGGCGAWFQETRRVSGSEVRGMAS